MDRRVLRDLIVHLCTNSERPLSRTELVKLVYLCDVEFYRRYRRMLTDLQYRFWEHGPFTWDIVDVATSLASEGAISFQELLAPDGKTWYLYGPGRVEYVVSSLDEHALSVCEEVLRKYGGQFLGDLLDQVYTSLPTRLFTRGALVDFARWLPSYDLDRHTRLKVDRQLRELRDRISSEEIRAALDTPGDPDLEDEAELFASSIFDEASRLAEEESWSQQDMED